MDDIIIDHKWGGVINDFNKTPNIKNNNNGIREIIIEENEILEKFKNKIKELESEVKNLKIERVQFREKIEDLKNSKKELINDVDYLRNYNKELKNDVDYLRNYNKELKNDINVLNNKK